MTTPENSPAGTTDRPDQAPQARARHPSVPPVSSEKDKILDGPWPPDEDMMALYGTQTPEAAKALFVTAIEALGQDVGRYRPLIAAIGIEEGPQSSLESMLLIQLVTTHIATIRAASQLNTGTQMHPKWMKMMTSGSSTFLRQLEALRKLRGGGDQTVRVEHVTVNEGGQAIVGAVGGGGGKARNVR